MRYSSYDIAEKALGDRLVSNPIFTALLSSAGGLLTSTEHSDPQDKHRPHVTSVWRTGTMVHQQAAQHQFLSVVVTGSSPQTNLESIPGVIIFSGECPGARRESLRVVVGFAMSGLGQSYVS